MTSCYPSTAVRLADWYRAERRDLPWRQTRDPYAIWVSETMLQQTRVETVIPYYHAFLQAFPTVQALAAASQEDVLKRWQGLGYYRRVKNLHNAAQQVVERHRGVVPEMEVVFRELSGVGPYTSGAVMSIAFGKPVPAVDGNVLRVLTRFLGIAEAIERPHVRHQVTAAVAGWLEQEDPSDLTQAIMELGAMVCTPRSPKCLLCPIASECNAVATGRTDAIPLRLPKKARRLVDVYALWLERDGQIVLQKRPSEGLLGDMWQLPAREVSAQQDMSHERQAEVLWSDVITAQQPAPVGLLVADAKSDPQPNQGPWNGPAAVTILAEESHVFTHLEWVVHVCRPVGPLTATVWPSEQGYEWVARADIVRLPLPRVYDKLFTRLLAEPERLA